MSPLRSLLVGGMMLIPASCVAPKAPPAAPQVPNAMATAVNTCLSLVKIQSRSTGAAIAEQNRWIEARYPGAIKLRQSMVQCNEVPVDVVTFRHGAVERSVLFDISSFYGRVGRGNLDGLLDG